METLCFVLKTLQLEGKKKKKCYEKQSRITIDTVRSEAAIENS